MEWIFMIDPRMLLFIAMTQDPILHPGAFIPARSFAYAGPNGLGLSARSCLRAERDLLLEAFV
jgi:hypothetical protein